MEGDDSFSRRDMETRATSTHAVIDRVRVWIHSRDVAPSFLGKATIRTRHDIRQTITAH
jgi:hypothetical protein